MVEGTTQVIPFLLGHRDIYICEACIAFALEVGVSEVHKVTGRLARNDEFRLPRRPVHGMCAR